MKFDDHIVTLRVPHKDVMDWSKTQNIMIRQILIDLETYDLNVYFLNEEDAMMCKIVFGGTYEYKVYQG